LGVRRAIEAAVKFKLGKDNLEGLHITIQGAGHVGYHLAKELSALGVRLTMSDINRVALQKCVDEFHVSTCEPNAIYDIKADVFAPCALGAVLNLNTIKRLRVPIVAGSANNQLAHHHHGVMLREANILYAPDFVINAGGLIFAAAMYDHSDTRIAREQVGNIYQTLMRILELSEKENKAPVEIAEAMAMERLR
jgi:leucine dehydrogenase